MDVPARWRKRELSLRRTFMSAEHNMALARRFLKRLV